MEEAARTTSSSSAHPPVHVVEIWANEKYVVGLIDFSLNGGEWIQHPRLPYSFKSDNSPAPEPDSYTLPSGNCRWTTNWKVRIDRSGTTTDSRGWEYATRLRTFETTSADRQPRTIKTLSDNARRRCYYREYRRYDQNRLDEEMINEVQVGLVIIQGIRKRLQILSNQLKGRLREDREVLELIKTVKSSISNIQDKIKLVEESSGSNEKLALTVKKFKTDIKKEQGHLENIGIHTATETSKVSAPSTPLSSSFSSPSSSLTPSSGMKSSTRVGDETSQERKSGVYHDFENPDEDDDDGSSELRGNQQTLAQYPYGWSDDDRIEGVEYDPVEERSKSIEKIRADLTEVITQLTQISSSSSHDYCHNILLRFLLMRILCRISSFFRAS